VKGCDIPCVRWDTGTKAHKINLIAKGTGKGGEILGNECKRLRKDDGGGPKKKTNSRVICVPVANCERVPIQYRIKLNPPKESGGQQGKAEVRYLREFSLGGGLVIQMLGR